MLRRRSPLNGAVHIVVPGRFILFRSPAVVPGGGLWADEGAERRFSAAFYADLLRDLGVTWVRSRLGWGRHAPPECQVRD